MINKVILVGRLGKDPEVRHFEGDSSVAAFSVATDDSYFDKLKGERIDRAQWVNVVLWNQLAGVAEKYLKKGSLVYIEGKITTRKWQDKDGNDRYTTEVLGRVMKMLSKAEGSNYSNVPSASDAPPQVSNTAEPKKETPAVSTETATPAAATEKKPEEAGDDLPF